MTPPRLIPALREGSPAEHPHSTDLVWLGLGICLFAVTASIAYRPTMDRPATIAAAALPVLTIAGLSVALTGDLFRPSSVVTATAVAVAIGGWGLLLSGDDRWSILSIVIYAACYRSFADNPYAAIASSAVATGIWAVAWSTGDTPGWTVVVPLAVFVAGTALYSALRELGRLNREQAELIAELRSTRSDLAAAERAKGVVIERARMAGEIHDTLAQGFTSIVLLCRAARRSQDDQIDLSAIEATATDNLEAARRLIDDMGPHELDLGSLTEALQREVDGLPPAIDGVFRVEGSPRHLEAETETTILRAAKELLLNVTTHSGARAVEVTLSFLGDVVALDVRDDGTGIERGKVSDRGALTGGQGLVLLRQRARLLGGDLTLEGDDDAGAVVSLHLPVPR